MPTKPYGNRGPNDVPFEHQLSRANTALSVLEFFLNAKRKFNKDEPDIMVPQEVIELEVTAAKVLQNFLSLPEETTVVSEARMITAEDRAKLP